VVVGALLVLLLAVAGVEPLVVASVATTIRAALWSATMTSLPSNKTYYIDLALDNSRDLEIPVC
jgi:hypothetical protein